MPTWTCPDCVTENEENLTDCYCCGEERPQEETKGEAKEETRNMGGGGSSINKVGNNDAPHQREAKSELTEFIGMRSGGAVTSMRGHEDHVLNSYTTLMRHYPRIVALGGLAFGHKLATVVYFDLEHNDKCCEFHESHDEAGVGLALEICTSCQRLTRPPLQRSHLAPFHLGVTGWLRAALRVAPRSCAEPPAVVEVVACGSSMTRYTDLSDHRVTNGRLLLPTPADLWCPGRPSAVAEFIEGVIRNGQSDVMALLLRYCTPEVMLSLDRALAYGWATMAKLLAAQPSVDLNQALKMAVRRRNAEVVVWLLQQGVSPNVKIPTFDPFRELLKEVIDDHEHFRSVSRHEVAALKQGMDLLGEQPPPGNRALCAEGYFENRDGFYGHLHRQEVLHITLEEEGVWQGVKVVGDANVPRGKLSFRTEGDDGEGDVFVHGDLQGGACGKIQVRMDTDDPHGFSWLGEDADINTLLSQKTGAVEEWTIVFFQGMSRFHRITEAEALAAGRKPDYD